MRGSIRFKMVSQVGRLRDGNIDPDRKYIGMTMSMFKAMNDCICWMRDAIIIPNAQMVNASSSWIPNTSIIRTGL